MTPLHELSIAEAGRRLRDGTLTSTELTQDALARIAALDPLVHAFVLVTDQRALDDAARADRDLQGGLDRGPMHGIPYALKDVFATAGIRTTSHSKLFADHEPREDCAVEVKLKAAGGVLLGKLATHEFALGGPSFDLPFPPARNPWNLERFTGASSSGSGAAVAAGFARAALGTDTSGSIRGPACHCGVVGLKPTYGLVSRRGVFPLSYSLDHCGPLTWTVEDCALVTSVIVGFDRRDPSSVEAPARSYTADIGQDLAGLKIAYPRRFFSEAAEISPEVLASIDAAAGIVANSGAVVDEVALPRFELFNACGRIIMMAEAYAIHEHDLKTRPRDYGRYTYQRMIAGATIAASDLVQAFRARTELTTAINTHVFGTYDALMTACALTPPARLADFPADWPPPASATATQTIAFNVTGNPALAVPTGFSNDGLPLGMQIVGRMFDEATLFRIGAAHEAAAHRTRIRPALQPTAA